MQLRPAFGRSVQLQPLQFGWQSPGRRTAIVTTVMLGLGGVGAAIGPGLVDTLQREFPAIPTSPPMPTTTTPTTTVPEGEPQTSPEPEPSATEPVETEPEEPSPFSIETTTSPDFSPAPAAEEPSPPPVTTTEPVAPAAPPEPSAAPAPEPPPPRGTKKPRVIFEGDSLSSYTGNGYSYADQLGARLQDRGIDVQHKATSGDMLTRQIKEDISGIKNLYDPSRRDNVVVLWAGTNDLHAGKSGQELYAQYKQTVSEYKKKGFKVLVLTSAQLGSGPETAQDKQRQIFNDLIRKNGGPWDGVVDIGKMPEFSDRSTTAAANSTYYAGDGVHLTKAGYGLVARQVEKALNQLLRSN